MDIELLWFEDCPNHEAAALMLRDVLNEAGIVIAFPQRDVHVDSPDPISIRILREPRAPGTGHDDKPV